VAIKATAKMKIYTKTGDKGMTSLATGKRVSKADVRLDAYGTADELNSFFGLLRNSLKNSGINCADKLDKDLCWVQNRLFDLGAVLAGSDMEFKAENVCQLEGWIDEMDAELQPLRAFVLPGGNEQVALCHVCRTVARRLERLMVAMGCEGNAEVWLRFVNRMSDYCFVLARFVGQKMEIEPLVWEK
jgi:cob(I)alamin adenosyltransferase